MGKQGGTFPSHYHGIIMLELSKLANTKTFGCAGKSNKSDRKKQHLEGLPYTVFFFDTHTSLFLPSSDSLLVWTASHCSWLTWTIWNNMKWFQETWKGLHVIITSANRNNKPKISPGACVSCEAWFYWTVKCPTPRDLLTIHTLNTQLDTHTQI